MTPTSKTKVRIIGVGTGGCAARIRSGQLGLVAMLVFAGSLLAVFPAKACAVWYKARFSTLEQQDAHFSSVATFAATGTVISRSVDTLRVHPDTTLRGEAQDEIVLDDSFLIDCDGPPVASIPDDVDEGQTVLVLGVRPDPHQSEFRYAVPLESLRGRRLQALLSNRNDLNQ